MGLDVYEVNKLSISISMKNPLEIIIKQLIFLQLCVQGSW